MQKFNLNDYILVQITEYGWEHLEKKVKKDYIKHCIIPYKKIIEGVEWYKLQAHEIISLFGSALFIASHSPIKSNILIPEERD